MSSLSEAYFAYGSNMCPDQMCRRCPSARFRAIAALPGHELCFPRFTQRWGGGAASVRPNPDRNVEGVVYTLSPDDLEALDGYEGVAAGRYNRLRITVHIEEADTLEAWTYVAIPEPGGPFPPAAAYLETIMRGAERHGLPGEYVAHLETFRKEA